MRKDVILGDLGSEVVEPDKLHRFQDGKERAGFALYTRQHSELVNGCQILI